MGKLESFLRWCTGEQSLSPGKTLLYSGGQKQFDSGPQFRKSRQLSSGIALLGGREMEYKIDAR
jgi:hypothetical protein